MYAAGTEETENSPRGGRDFRDPIGAMGETKTSQKGKGKKKMQ